MGMLRFNQIIRLPLILPSLQQPYDGATLTFCLIKERMPYFKVRHSLFQPSINGLSLDDYRGRKVEVLVHIRISPGRVELE